MRLPYRVARLEAARRIDPRRCPRACGIRVFDEEGHDPRHPVEPCQLCGGRSALILCIGGCRDREGRESASLDARAAGDALMALARRLGRLEHATLGRGCRACPPVLVVRDGAVASACGACGRRPRLVGASHPRCRAAEGSVSLARRVRGLERAARLPQASRAEVHQWATGYVANRLGCDWFAARDHVDAAIEGYERHQRLIVHLPRGGENHERMVRAVAADLGVDGDLAMRWVEEADAEFEAYLRSPERNYVYRKGGRVR